MKNDSQVKYYARKLLAELKCEKLIFEYSTDTLVIVALNGENIVKTYEVVDRPKFKESRKCVVCGKEYIPNVKHRARSQTCSKECHYILVANRESKRIDQFDKNGNYLKTWNSIRDIGRWLNKDATNIVKVCKGKLRSAYGYVWKYSKMKGN